jgi:hypothetical protein
VKILGPRQSPVSSPATPEPSEPVGERVVSESILKDIHTSGQRDGVSGAALKTGGSHGNNCQTVTYELKQDGYDVGSKLELRLNKVNGGSLGTLLPDPTQGQEIPTKWKPIKIGGGHGDNVFKGDTVADLQPVDTTSSGAQEEQAPSIPVGSLATLLRRLFPRELPGPVLGRADKPGLTHANNVLMDAAPTKDRGNIL